MVAERVEQFRPIVLEELARGGYPFPAALILSIIHAESRGKAGSVNPKSGASGLMQIMPIALKDYNQRNGTNYKMSDLKRTDAKSIEIQIRIGTFMIGHFWKTAYRYLKDKLDPVSLEDLQKIAQMFYVAGPGAAQKKLNTLTAPTFAMAAEKFEGWNPIVYIKEIWRQIEAQNPVWDLNKIDDWVRGSISPTKPPLIAKTDRNGFLIAIAIVAVASFYLKKK